MSYNNLTILEHDFHGLPSLCYADLSNNYIHTMLAELVSKTKCINHKVHNRLEIILQGKMFINVLFMYVIIIRIMFVFFYSFHYVINRKSNFVPK